MATISTIVIAPSAVDALPALESIAGQDFPDRETIVVATSGDSASGARIVRPPAGATPGAIRNAGIEAATGGYVCVIEPGEVLRGKDSLSRHVAALEADRNAIASYGRTEVDEGRGTLRAMPDRGRGGLILRRLVQHKGFIASSASVVWRRSMLPSPVYDDVYRTPSGLLLSLLIAASADRPFLFQQATVAHAPAERSSLEVLEESVKIFVALLYGATQLDERIEPRVRFQLSRHLVSLGKHHYRKGDHARAGRLFAEAVKAAPGYFRGRRYQFMNFLRGVIARA